MYVKSCPEIHHQICEGKYDAEIAGIILKTISQRFRPQQTDVEEEPPQNSPKYVFSNDCGFRIMVVRDIRDYDPSGSAPWTFFFDIGHNMGDRSNADVMNTAAQENSSLILPYCYTYPAIGRKGGVPCLVSESGLLSIYVICENAPAPDLGRLLAEEVATTYVDTVESYKGHTFQVSTKQFIYTRPYRR